MCQGLHTDAFAVDLHELVKVFFTHVKTAPIQIAVAGHPADRGFLSPSAPGGALDDPAEWAHVVAEAWPHPFGVPVLAEPVDVEDARGLGELALHFDPMAKIVAHVVAAEGEHGHWVAADSANITLGCGRHFRACRGAEVDAVTPVKGLRDQWHIVHAATSEDHGMDAHALRFFPIGVDDWTIGGWGGEPTVGVGRWRLAIGRPIPAFPVNEMCGCFLGHALPPDVAVVR